MEVEEPILGKLIEAFCDLPTCRRTAMLRRFAGWPPSFMRKRTPQSCRTPRCRPPCGRFLTAAARGSVDLLGDLTAERFLLGKSTEMITESILYTVGQALRDAPRPVELLWTEPLSALFAAGKKRVYWDLSMSRQLIRAVMVP